MEEKKIIKEQDGKAEEITKEKLEEITSNPDFKVTPKQESDTEKVVGVQQRLYD